MTGLIFGFFLHGKEITWKSCTACQPDHNPGIAICCLDTLWLSILMGDGFIALLPTRILKCVVDASYPSDFDPVRMEPHRIEDTVCRTDDGVEKNSSESSRLRFSSKLFYFTLILPAVSRSFRKTSG